MKVYLAAAYGRRDELMGYADVLRLAGHEVTARWIDGRHDTPPDGMAPDSVEHLGWAAAEDVADVLAADWLIGFTGGATRARGGRHVKWGIALATGKRLTLIGERENVFHCLPGVEVFPDWTAFVRAVAS